MAITLISIPADPTRSYALELHWPGLGYYDWTARLWRPDLAPQCLMPMVADGDGDLFVWLDLPPTAGDVALKLRTLDPAGNPVQTVATETISAG